jgi:hypothetical protein
MIEVVKATHKHAGYIADHMRAADVAEIAAFSGRMPGPALAHSLDRSDFALTVLFENVPAVMFGCRSINLLARSASPWLLGTDQIETRYRQFLRGSTVYLKGMMVQYDHLINAVDDRNEVSKRWLAWLGFDIGEPIVMGAEKRMFRVFEMRSKNV